MENNNIETVDKVIQAFKTGDINVILDMLAEDATWIVPFALSDPLAGTYKGKEAIIKLFKMLGGIVELLEYNIERYIADNDTVIVLGNKKIKYIANQRIRNLKFVYRVALKAEKIYMFDTFQRELSGDDKQ